MEVVRTASLDTIIDKVSSKAPVGRVQHTVGGVRRELSSIHNLPIPVFSGPAGAELQPGDTEDIKIVPVLGEKVGPDGVNVNAVTSSESTGCKHHHPHPTMEESGA